MKNLKEELDSHKRWLDSIGKEGKQLFLDEVDLQEADFSDMCLLEAIMVMVTFDFAKMVNTDMSNCNLSSSSFLMANLTGARMSKAIAHYSSFKNATLENLIANRAEFVFANFQDANLKNADLNRASFFGSNLINADLRNADLTNASLDQCSLHGAKLRGVKGFESVLINWIDIGPKDDPQKLSGELAKQWLLATAK